MSANTLQLGFAKILCINNRWKHQWYVVWFYHTNHRHIFHAHISIYSMGRRLDLSCYSFDREWLSWHDSRKSITCHFLRNTGALPTPSVMQTFFQCWDIHKSYLWFICGRLYCIGYSSLSHLLWDCFSLTLLHNISWHLQYISFNPMVCWWACSASRSSYYSNYTTDSTIVVKWSMHGTVHKHSILCTGYSQGPSKLLSGQYCEQCTFYGCLPYLLLGNQSPLCFQPEYIF